MNIRSRIRIRVRTKSVRIHNTAFTGTFQNNYSPISRYCPFKYPLKKFSKAISCLSYLDFLETLKSKQEKMAHESGKFLFYQCVLEFYFPSFFPRSTLISYKQTKSQHSTTQVSVQMACRLYFFQHSARRNAMEREKSSVVDPNRLCPHPDRGSHVHYDPAPALELNRIRINSDPDPA